jgi:hypothetical protein
MQVAFSVTKSRPFRSLGLYKSSGKHAAPKGWVPEQRPAADSSDRTHRPAHAATKPRLTGPHAENEQAETEQVDTAQADTAQQAA